MADPDAMVDELLAAADEPSPEELKMAPILACAESGDVAGMSKALDAAGVPIDQKGEDGDTALHIGCLWGRLAIVEECLKRGASVVARDEDNSTPLHDASAGGHYDIVKLLLAKGASVQAVDNDGESPLHLAANGGHQHVVTLLLSHLAPAAASSLLKKPNEAGETPIDLAEDPALIAQLNRACIGDNEAPMDEDESSGAAFKRAKA